MYDAVFPYRRFLVARSWQILPHAATTMQVAMHVHLWHYCGNTAVCVPQRGLMQLGKGDMLYLFHHRVHLPEPTMWPVFVTQCQDVCYVTV